MESVLLPTAYLPNIAYLSKVINTAHVVIEQHEFYVKQTQRNRCDILSSSGALRLSIPLVHQSDKEIINQKRISYAEKWQHQHWRTITTAYKSSPYFEFFEQDFKPFYENKYEFLFEYNTELLKTILHILRVKKTILFTEKFEIDSGSKNDFRKVNFSETSPNSIAKPYYQVFEDRLGFTPNLSCIDAIFNIALEVKDL